MNSKASDPTPDKPQSPRHLHPADLRGVAKLATHATLGVTRIAEGVHQSVLSTLGAPSGKEPGQSRGLTGLVYKTVRGATQLVGKGVDTALAALQPWLDLASKPGGPAPSPQREAVLAALNGVMGDTLLANQSPFATPMTFRYSSPALPGAKADLKPLDLNALPSDLASSSKVLLLIHGLCMDDRCWLGGKDDGDDGGHARALYERLGYLPLYLRYNTGLHISQNGHQLALELERLVQGWPTAFGNVSVLEELSVLAHSMGGLVIRSAFHSAQQRGMRWPSLVKNIVFLGTPHHGAPLERAGNWIDVILGSTPFTAPFAKLGQLRSAGITDLRYGLAQNADWEGRDRFARSPDRRQRLPLPDGVACYTVAATLAKVPERGARGPADLTNPLPGDGLVPLNSALGRHTDPLRTLAFAKPSQYIAYGTHHMALLKSPEVTKKLIDWLSPAA